MRQSYFVNSPLKAGSNCVEFIPNGAWVRQPVFDDGDTEGFGL